jgi:hypothetical protein
LRWRYLPLVQCLVIDGDSSGAWGMEKWFCLAAMAIAGLLLLLFMLDMAMGIPFGKANFVVDICGFLASGVVIFLGFDAFKDLS